MLLTISLVFFIVSAIGIGYFLRSHREGVDAAHEKHEAGAEHMEKKTSILEDRLKRKLVDRVSSVGAMLKPIAERVAKHSKTGYDKLREKEREYTAASEQVTHERKKFHEQKEAISEKLESIDDASEDEEVDREQAYLDVLELDPKNIDAYEGLAALYMERKQFEEATELYAYIVSLGVEQVEHMLEWAQGLSELERYEDVLEVLVKAHDIAPKSPKIIDRVIETAILLEDKLTARKFLKLLSEVNPENNKIEEYEEQIDEIR